MRGTLVPPPSSYLECWLLSKNSPAPWSPTVLTLLVSWDDVSNRASVSDYQLWGGGRLKRRAYFQASCPQAVSFEGGDVPEGSPQPSLPQTPAQGSWVWRLGPVNWKATPPSPPPQPAALLLPASCLSSLLSFLTIPETLRQLWLWESSELGLGGGEELSCLENSGVRFLGI